LESSFHEFVRDWILLTHLARFPPMADDQELELAAGTVKNGARPSTPCPN
jgi:hypothetical protein